MRNTFNRKITRAFASCLAILILLSAISLVTLYKAREKALWVQHTHAVLEKLELLLSVMKDAETGARGYVITKKAATLSPYYNAVKQCKTILVNIKQLTSDNPQQQASIPVLHENIDTQLRLLNQYIVLTNAGKAVSSEQIETGKLVMDEARQLIKHMKDREYHLLQERNDSWNTTWAFVPVLIVLLTITSVISTTYFCRSLKINYFEKVKYRRKVQQQAIETAHRIKLIQSLTAEVTEGNYTIRLSDAEKDTLGILASDINKMIASLDHSFNTLNEWMKKKDEFIDITAHELKTPLTSIKAIVQFIARMKFSDEETKKIYPFVTKANNQVNRLTEIVKDLLEVSKISNGQLTLNCTNFSLTNVIADCMEEIRPVIKGHELVLENKGDIIVWADKFKVHQVVTNLISNAVKYSLPDTKVLVDYKVEDGFVHVIIADEGIGIPTEKLPFIFDRYFRVEETSQNYSGLGLGLYISKGIVAQHGGTIGVDSNPGQGTTFWFTLPINTQTHTSAT